MFLTDAELHALTGRHRAKAQAKFLRSRRIRHVVNAAGKVVVARAWLEQREPDVQAPEPNFAALKAVG